MSESDEELNDLLDDAIKDFKVFKDEQPPQIPLHTTAPLSESLGAVGEDFTSNEKMFEEVFKELMSSNSINHNEDFLATFLNNSDLNGGLQPDLSDKLKTAFDSLKDDMGSLPNGDIEDEELMKMMSDLGIGEDAIEGLASTDPTNDSFFSAMQGMMRNLLSKDILYPSLKDVARQYPEWLTNNATVASPEDLQRYSSQFAIIEKIIKEFDSETSTDSENVKMTRFQRILNLMQAMQPLGQPPPELLAHLPKDVELDSNGLPKFPPQLFQNFNGTNSYTDNCALM